MNLTPARRMRGGIRLWWSLLVIPLLFLAAFASRNLLMADNPPVYLTAAVMRTDLQRAVMATGTLQAQQQVDVGAQVSGQIKTLHVGLGEHVRKGQLLAEIDPVLSVNALRAARASLEGLNAQSRAAEANVWQADTAYKRQLDMISKEATSQQDVETAKVQMHVARANLSALKAQIAQAQTQVDTAQANLAYTRITAPIDGDVVAIVTQEGQTVVAAQQAPVILKLAQLDRMTVRAQISESDVIRIQPEQEAYFSIMGDAESRYSGKLRAIEPAPQDYTNENGAKIAGPVFYNALFETVNEDHRLRIGMTAQVTIVLEEAKNTLSIPIASLGQRSADGRYPVRVLNMGQSVATRLVGVGINDGVNVQVLTGLREGEQVITAEETGKHGRS